MLLEALILEDHSLPSMTTNLFSSRNFSHYGSSSLQIQVSCTSKLKKCGTKTMAVFMFYIFSVYLDYIEEGSQICF